jgi:hypothetical protein
MRLGPIIIIEILTSAQKRPPSRNISRFLVWQTHPFTSGASSKTIGSSSAPRFIFPNGDSPPICRFNLLKKTDTGFNVAVPHFSTTDRQAFTWIEQVVPATILALLKNYTDPSKNISGKTYPLVNANISYAELAELTGKGAVSFEISMYTRVC